MTPRRRWKHAALALTLAWACSEAAGPTTPQVQPQFSGGGSSCSAVGNTEFHPGNAVGGWLGCGHTVEVKRVTGPSTYGSSIQLAVDEWANELFDNRYGLPTLVYNQGTDNPEITLNLQVDDGGARWCGQGSTGSMLAWDTTASASICGRGNNAIPISSLSSVLKHELSEALTFDSQGWVDGSPIESCLVVARPGGNSRLCEHERQITYHGYTLRADLPDLTLDMVRLVSLPGHLDLDLVSNPSSDEAVMHFYTGTQHNPPVPSTTFVSLDPTVATAQKINSSLVRITAQGVGQTRIVANVAAGPTVMWEGGYPTDTMTVTVAGPPSQPTGADATPVSSSKIRLTWDANPPGEGVTSYRILRRPTGQGQFVQVGQVSGTVFMDTGLSTYTSYGYRIKAVNAVGESTKGAVAGARTSPTITLSPSRPRVIYPQTVTVVAEARDASGSVIAGFSDVLWTANPAILQLNGSNPASSINLAGSSTGFTTLYATVDEEETATALVRVNCDAGPGGSCP